ncbi:hypothetical protein WR25_13027 isoform B [Diploscapter pachys]|nr:hypothetical protein WR25_13027 isoform B [Diploscapter pachys]
MCCPSGGLWTDWTATGTCGDTCGSCAQQTYTRQCITEDQGCPCTGNTERVQMCGINVCLYPRSSCCGNYTKMLDRVKRVYYCGPQPNYTEPASDTSCCPPNGFFGLWSEWSSCTDTCGLCGTQSRNRTCASASYGCQCT